mmetsp:Transcript_69600/g.213386  ORF Transcript_69600/g.213386 Transcript_69600/m.213386 type:complete len:226 (+) Transcript_69600:428-1105(+)
MALLLLHILVAPLQADPLDVSEDVQLARRAGPESLQLAKGVRCAGLHQLQRPSQAQWAELAAPHVRVERSDVAVAQGHAEGLEAPSAEHAERQKRPVDEADGRLDARGAHRQLEGWIRQQGHREARHGAELARIRPPSRPCMAASEAVRRSRGDLPRRLLRPLVRRRRRDPAEVGGRLALRVPLQAVGGDAELQRDVVLLPLGAAGVALAGRGQCLVGVGLGLLE